MTIIDVALLDYLFIRGGSPQRVKADPVGDFDLVSRYTFNIINIYLRQGMEQPH